MGVTSGAVRRGWVQSIAACISVAACVGSPVDAGHLLGSGGLYRVAHELSSRVQRGAVITQKLLGGLHAARAPLQQSLAAPADVRGEGSPSRAPRSGKLDDLKAQEQKADSVKSRAVSVGTALNHTRESGSDAHSARRATLLTHQSSAVSQNLVEAPTPRIGEIVSGRLNSETPIIRIRHGLFENARSAGEPTSDMSDALKRGTPGTMELGGIGEPELNHTGTALPFVDLELPTLRQQKDATFVSKNDVNATGLSAIRSPDSKHFENFGFYTPRPIPYTLGHPLSTKTTTLPAGTDIDQDERDFKLQSLGSPSQNTTRRRLSEGSLSAEKRKRRKDVARCLVTGITFDPATPTKQFSNISIYQCTDHCLSNRRSCAAFTYSPLFEECSVTSKIEGIVQNHIMVMATVKCLLNPAENSQQFVRSGYAGYQRSRNRGFETAIPRRKHQETPLQPRRNVRQLQEYGYTETPAMSRVAGRSAYLGMNGRHFDTVQSFEPLRSRDRFVQTSRSRDDGNKEWAAPSYAPIRPFDPFTSQPDYASSATHPLSTSKANGISAREPVSSRLASSSVRQSGSSSELSAKRYIHSARLLEPSEPRRLASPRPAAGVSEARCQAPLNREFLEAIWGATSIQICHELCQWDVRCVSYGYSATERRCSLYGLAVTPFCDTSRFGTFVTGRSLSGGRDYRSDKRVPPFTPSATAQFASSSVSPLLNLPPPTTYEPSDEFGEFQNPAAQDALIAGYDQFGNPAPDQRLLDSAYGQRPYAWNIQGPRGRSAKTRGRGLVKSTTTMLAVGNNVLETFGINELAQRDLSGPSSGRRKLKRVAGGVPLGVDDKFSGLVGPPSGVGNPEAACFFQGMRCCVPVEAVPRMARKLPLLGGVESRTCQAIYVSRLNMFCVTLQYASASCNQAVIVTGNTTVYRNIMVLPSRRMNNALCECTLQSASDTSNVTVKDGLAASGSARWLFSSNAAAERAEANKRVRDLAMNAKDGLKGALRIGNAVSKSVGEPPSPEVAARAEHFLDSAVTLSGRLATNAELFPGGFHRKYRHTQRQPRRGRARRHWRPRSIPPYVR